VLQRGNLATLASEDQKTAIQPEPEPEPEETSEVHVCRVRVSCR